MFLPGRDLYTGLSCGIEWSRISSKVTFKNCELHLSRWSRPPNFQDNNLVDSVFVFTDAAICTLYFLSNVYHAGRGGRRGR